ncbi:hypothetical protein, partial [Halorubrum aquaticum]|uniref:hypothetical protein n=1 Tax=Halorubrum aquaticum TaxID=387340 RepID=UPI001CB6D4C3
MRLRFGWDSKGQSPAAEPPAARGAERLAATRTKPGEVSTAGANKVSDEEHNEPRESSWLGLWRCSLRQQR